MKSQINIITLGVNDLESSIRFYTEGLGWKKSKASEENIVFYQLGGLVLALYPRNLLSDDATVAFSADGYPPFSLAYNTHSEEETDKVIKKAVECGAKLIKPAQKVFWGGYSGYIADPNGFLWEIAYNPFFELDEQENIVLP